MDDKQKLLMRRYLLGAVDEGEREQVEERFFSDPEYHAELLGSEEDLVGDYLENNLSVEDRNLFRTHYLATPQKLQSVQLTAALLRYCSTAEAETTRPEAFADSNRQSRARQSSVRTWRFAYAAVAIAALITVSVTLTLIFRKTRGPTESDISRELRELNSPHSAGKTPGTSIILLPVTLRGEGESSKLSLRPGTEVVQLILVLPRDDYPAYTIIIQRDDDAKPLTVDDLPAANTAAGKALSLKLPARFMGSQDYAFEVKGLTPDGTLKSVAEYTLKVHP